MIDEAILKSEEKAVLSLRDLYRKFGYRPYKMGKFEEYDFYVKNKDFLLSENVITFNDTNGKLMALKPDVTLSIIKNCKYEPGMVQRVYYNENVYRVSGSTHAYKEIMQSGLECFGEIDIHNKLEVLHLAAESLAAISEDFVLEISHMGVLAALLKEAGGGSEFDSLIATCIGEKNAHEIPGICRNYGVYDSVAEKLIEFTGIYGAPSDVTKKLKSLCDDDAGEFESVIDELEIISSAIAASPYKDNIIFDFSIAGDMKYYNGIVFRGFISGIPESVLSGGQYNRLMKKIGKKGGAIGFAVYLDLLEMLGKRELSYDVDTVLLYDEETDGAKLICEVLKLNEQGISVSTQRTVPESLSFKSLMKMTDKGAVKIG